MPRRGDGRNGHGRVSQVSEVDRKKGALRREHRAAQELQEQQDDRRAAQGRYEWLMGRSGTARKWWQRSLRLAEEMGQRFYLGKTHLEISQWLGDRAHLERAESIFEEIGAEWELALAREKFQTRIV